MVKNKDKIRLVFLEKEENWSWLEIFIEFFWFFFENWIEYLGLYGKRKESFIVKVFLSFGNFIFF